MTVLSSPRKICACVVQATCWCRKRYQDDDRYRHCTEAAMAEQVCGVEGVMSDLSDGWWRVGVVMDVISGVQLVYRLFN